MNDKMGGTLDLEKRFYNNWLRGLWWSGMVCQFGAEERT
jgi:hypothetical protein